MRKRILSLITIATAISCQQQLLDAVIVENKEGLEAISFSADTITFGDSIRIAAKFKTMPSDEVIMSFINIDDKEKIIEYQLNPDTSSLTDTLVMDPYSLAAGWHTISFHVSAGYESKKEEVELFVYPASTDFFEDSGVYLYNGTLFGSYYKLDIPESNIIDIPLGRMGKITILTGLKMKNVLSHGLSSNLFKAWIESDEFIADYVGLGVDNLMYYFHSASSDKGDCYAIMVSLYPLMKGEGDIVIQFCDKIRRIPIRVTDPKDIIKL